MKRNLVLIQPVIGDMDMFRGHPTPPIGLLAAASVICSELDVRLVDQRADKDWRGTLARVLDEGTVAIGVATARPPLSGAACTPRCCRSRPPRMSWPIL